jgi:cyclophilin family peptidyl-prolyl cis-trans isomerase
MMAAAGGGGGEEAAGIGARKKKAKPLSKGLYAVFETAQGTFTARLYEEATPRTVRNFVALADGVQATADPQTKKPVRRRFYDGVTFHRVVRGEMIQAGDPTGVGNHNCGVTIPDEIRPGLRFVASGTLAMANTGEPNSGGCQFFVTVNPMGVWNEKYTIFGVVVQGLEVVEAINRMPGRGERPVAPVRLHRVTIQRVVGPPSDQGKER